MSQTRDIIQEIADIRKRRKFDSGVAELPSRLFALEMAFRNVDKSQTELMRYFPVAIIACVEGYFRLVITELVDKGEPFLSNVEKPQFSNKIDFQVLRAVHGKTISVGELVAQNCSISRLEHIDRAISSILAEKFLDSLRTVSDRWAHEVQGKPQVPILSKPDEIFIDVIRTFELRHIICHELASGYQIDPSEIARCFKSCVLFLRAADELISDRLYPNSPLTQTEMNIEQYEIVNSKYERMHGAIKTLEKGFTQAEVEKSKIAQEAWEAYSNSWVDLISGDREHGGTIWPLIHGGAVETMLDNRIKEIENFKRFGDDL